MIGRKLNRLLLVSWRHKVQLFVLETDGLALTATPQCSTPQDSKLDGGRSRGRIRPKKATAAPIPIAQLQRHSPVLRTNLLFLSRLPRQREGKRVRACGDSPLGHWAMMVSLSVATVDAGGKRLGPMSVPSGSRNLISNCSWTPDISRDGPDAMLQRA